MTGSAVEDTDRNVTPIPLEGLSKPAQRALAGAGYTTLQQLAVVRERDVARLHGIGPNALAVLRQALAAHALAFAGDGE